MKKNLIYSICAALFVIAGCTKFDEETPIAFTKGPGVAIDVTAATDTSITFTVTPGAVAGYYSYLLVEKSKAPAAADSSRVLKLTYDGVAKGTVNYADSTSARIYVKKLTPNTAYQIYAVATNTSGMAGAVASEPANTGDNGNAPTPKTIAIADSTVSITFSEPIVRGEGALSVTFHAINARNVAAYNPTVAVSADSLSVSGAVLSINLPPHPLFGFVPAGAWVTVTYEAGVVKDLGGNPTGAATNTGAYNSSTGVYNGVSIRVATTTWGFEPVSEGSLIPIVDWATGSLTIVPDSTLFAPIASRAKTYQFIYKETGKSTVLSATGVSYNTARDTVYLRTATAEEAKRGAIIDAAIPAGAFVDYFGNASTAFAVEDAYIYSYGYTVADILGTYNISGTSGLNGDPINENGIVISDNPASDDENDVLIENLYTSGTSVNATFDPVQGILAAEDWVTIATDVIFGNFVDESGLVVFNVPQAGQITTAANYYWGYFGASDFIEVYAISTWTRQP